MTSPVLNPAADRADEGARHRIISDPAAWKVLLPLGAAVGAILLVRLLGEPIRRSVLIETPRAVPTEVREPADTREEGDRFLTQRDSVYVQLGRDISVGEFLDLYHLRNTRDIRAALKRQANVSNDSELLKKGTELRLHLTVPSR